MVGEARALCCRKAGLHARAVTPALLALVSGLALGLALIVAIGAQNAFVLRQGLRGEHVLPVVVVCAGSDLLLIAAGVAGAGALLDRAPGAVTVMTWAGVAFLGAYGALAAHRALRPSAALIEQAATPVATLPTVLTAAALTWLNPHVYLDTVVLLGAVAARRATCAGTSARGRRGQRAVVLGAGRGRRCCARSSPDRRLAGARRA
jgi:L-lysine exporter family protein LysE/ArgO